MKHTFLFGLALAALIVTSPAMAQAPPPPPVFTFNEDGAAFLGLNSPNPMRVRTFQSMDPVSGMTTLTLDIAGAGSGFPIPRAGDVVVTENVGAVPVLSDLLRFSNQGLLYVFSDTEVPRALADVGLPVAQAGAVITPEIGTEDTVNGLIYTPNDAQPGFIAGTTAQYIFISDTPEPATIALAGVGALGMIGYRLWRRNPVSA